MLGWSLLAREKIATPLNKFPIVTLST